LFAIHALDSLFLLTLHQDLNAIKTLFAASL
jgi:hypothetical protein